jgi:hypothetical protein
MPTTRLSSNAAVIARRMRQRATDAERELNGAARVLGPELAAEAKKLLQSEIYNVPIPLKKTADRSLSKNAAIRKRTTKGAAGQWQRTGNLKRSEGWRVEGATLYLTNNAEYAAARYTLGTSKSSRKIRTPTVRSVQWQEQAITAKRARILEVRRQAVLRALRAV